MFNEASVDVDTLEDFKEVERLLKKRKDIYQQKSGYNPFF